MIDIISIISALPRPKKVRPIFAETEDHTFVDLTRFIKPGQGLRFTLCVTVEAVLLDNGEVRCSYYDVDKGVHLEIEAPLEDVTKAIMQQKRYAFFRKSYFLGVWTTYNNRKTLLDIRHAHRRQLRKGAA